MEKADDSESLCENKHSPSIPAYLDSASHIHSQNNIGQHNSRDGFSSIKLQCKQGVDLYMAEQGEV